MVLTNNLQTTILVACVVADSFPFSGGAEIEQASERSTPGVSKIIGISGEGVSEEGVERNPSPRPLPLLLILPLFRSFPPVRERLEKETKRLLRRLPF